MNNYQTNKKQGERVEPSTSHLDLIPKGPGVKTSIGEWYAKFDFQAYKMKMEAAVEQLQKLDICKRIE
jgi:hypothetical protein